MKKLLKFHFLALPLIMSLSTAHAYQTYQGNDSILVQGKYLNDYEKGNIYCGVNLVWIHENEVFDTVYTANGPGHACRDEGEKSRFVRISYQELLMVRSKRNFEHIVRDRHARGFLEGRIPNDKIERTLRTSVAKTFDIIGDTKLSNSEIFLRIPIRDRDTKSCFIVTTIGTNDYQEICHYSDANAVEFFFSQY